MYIKMKSTKLLQRKKEEKSLRFTTSWKSVHVSCSEFLIFNVYAPEKKVKNKKNYKLAKRSYIYTVTHMVKFKSPPCDQLHTYGSNKIMIIKYERLEKGGIKKSGKKNKIKRNSNLQWQPLQRYSAILSSDAP